MCTYSPATSLNSVMQIDFLLVVAADRRARLLPDDRDDRLVVQLRVVQAVQQMDRARPGRRQADADFAGELGVRAGHEGGHLLVADLDEVEVVLRRARARR